jgi:queuine tRNA-ribosyltransferase
MQSAQFKSDFRPIEDDCGCLVCKNYTRAYLHQLAGKEQIGGQLLTYHNIAYQMRLMRDLRISIIDGSFPQFVRRFMKLQVRVGFFPSLADALLSP